MKEVELNLTRELRKPFGCRGEAEKATELFPGQRGGRKEAKLLVLSSKHLRSDTPFDQSCSAASTPTKLHTNNREPKGCLWRN